MLTKDYLRLKEIFSPEVLWEILPDRLLGKVNRKIMEGSSGFIKPEMEIMYPNGALMGDIYSAELGGYSEGDYVIFSLKDARDSEKIKRNQEYLQEAYNLEFASENELNEYENNHFYDKLDLLGRKLDQLIKEIETQKANIEVEIDRRAEESKQALVASLVKREEQLSKSESANKKKEIELEQREGKLKAQLQVVDGKQKELAQSMSKFREEGGEKFIKIFTSMDDDSISVTSALDTPLPKKPLQELKTFFELMDFSVSDAVSVQFLLSTICAAITGQFVVLSGPTGVGKTSMVNMFASALGAGHGVVPVRPSWIDPTDLLGFYNPQTGRYQPSPFMDRFLEAGIYTKANRMYFLALDEMNLSRVENYAADFLSRFEKARAGEGDAKISLYSKDIERQSKVDIDKFKDRDENDLKRMAVSLRHYDRYPSSMEIPEGLVMFGTINLDETTQHLSPKFLDRSFVIKIPSQELVENITEINNMNSQNQHLFDLSLNTVRGLLEDPNKMPAAAQDIWNDVLIWQEDYIQPLGIRLGFRFSQAYVKYMKIAANFNIEPHAAASAFLQSKLFPWISFNHDEKAVGDNDQTKMDVLENWANDDLIDNYPDEYGLQDALKSILERGSASTVVRYLE